MTSVSNMKKIFSRKNR